MTNQIKTDQSSHNNLALETGLSSAVDHKGAFAGLAITKMTSMSEILDDLKEEISFAHSEHKEAEEINEDNIESRDQVRRKFFLKRAQLIYGEDQGEYKEKKEQLTKKLKDTNPQSAYEIHHAIDEITKDKSEGFALLDDLAKSPELSAETHKLILEALNEYIRQNDKKIAAGFNTIDLAKEFSSSLSSPAEKLQTSYQNIIGDYSSIMPVLLEMFQEYGVEKFEMGIKYIQQAAEADLQSQYSSMSKAKIQHMLTELQGTKIFNSIKARLSDLLNRFSKDSVISSLGIDKTMRIFLQLASEAGKLNTLLLGHISATSNTNQLLFLQGIRDCMREIPDYLFDSVATKTRCISNIQQKIDHFILDADA